MDSVKILIATQSSIDFYYKLNTTYLPIEVGAELNKQILSLGYVKDNQGDNISNKNPNYCELTALYWAWKNLNVDILGLSHYRRYFLFNYKSFFKLDRIPINVANGEFITSITKSEIEIIQILDEFDIILPQKKKLKKSIYNDYKFDSACFENDFILVRDIILNKYPDYRLSVDIFDSHYSLYSYNMFIMRKDKFDQYMEWLFDILFEFEKCVDISNYSKTQSRVFGFLAERLFNLYIYHNKFNVKEYPIAYLNPQHRVFKIYNGSNIFISEFLYSILYFLNKHINIK